MIFTQIHTSFVNVQALENENVFSSHNIINVGGCIPTDPQQNLKIYDSEFDKNSGVAE